MLKFFKSGPNSSEVFNNIHLAYQGKDWDKTMHDLITFIDEQMGRIPIKVYHYLSLVLNMYRT